MNKLKKELENKIPIKLDVEFQNYKSNMLNEDKETIFEKSYQTCVMQELKDLIENSLPLYTSGELEGIFNTSDLLAISYEDWLKYDSCFSTEMENCLLRTCERIGKKYTYDKDER